MGRYIVMPSSVIATTVYSFAEFTRAVSIENFNSTSMSPIPIQHDTKQSLEGTARILESTYDNQRGDTELFPWRSYDSNNVDEMNQLMESERDKLQLNEKIRAEILSKLVPFLMLALAIYVILSVLWVTYNFISYRRQKNEAVEDAKIHWNSRLLKIYDDMPVLCVAYSNCDCPATNMLHARASI
ncbi:hypothetical protein DdX_00809 [Ditylenchus destructor]|uniref:Uncharacterized protein n=1 Tax=Ditylenchus destructor TaxID=166010 RepID=A0AAD4R7L1_9BILA|nr:hypothetical protein DdX_00809 [Ditylenchus destructor]